MGRYEQEAGMWRYCPSRELRRRIREIDSLKLSLKLEGRQYWNCECGMPSYYNLECPFYCKVDSGRKDVGQVKFSANHLCLAPERKGEIGCNIAPFNRKGYANFLRLEKWRGRFLLKWKHSVEVNEV